MDVVWLLSDDRLVLVPRWKLDASTTVQACNEAEEAVDRIERGATRSPGDRSSKTGILMEFQDFL